jgi:hypothetical protein
MSTPMIEVLSGVSFAHALFGFRSIPGRRSDAHKQGLGCLLLHTGWVGCEIRQLRWSRSWIGEVAA